MQKENRVDMKRMKELDCGLDDLINKLYDVVIDDNGWVQAGGDKKSMEWYEKCGDFAHNPKWKRRSS